MKKMIIAIVSLFMIMSFITLASAATVTATSASGGAAITLADSGAGPGVTFNPSPSTLISAATNATLFTITAASSKTTTANGIEYGVISGSNAMYQMTQAADNAVTASTTPGSLPSANFKDKNGNTAP